MRLKLPPRLRTWASKAATWRRFLPKTSKNSFQKVWASAFSAPVLGSGRLVQSREKAMARDLISFHERGMEQDGKNDDGKSRVGFGNE